MAGGSRAGVLLDLGYSLGGRLILLLPMAFCIFLLLDSQDKGIRLAALAALAILEQIREWLLVNGMQGFKKAGGEKQGPSKGK